MAQKLWDFRRRNYGTARRNCGILHPPCMGLVAHLLWVTAHQAWDLTRGLAALAVVSPLSSVALVWPLGPCRASGRPWGAGGPLASGGGRRRLLCLCGA